MKMKKRFAAILLGLSMALTLLPATVSAADPVNSSTGIRVNNELILEADNYTVQCGEGTAVYDPATNTLTLDNATIARTDTVIPISFYNGTLNIELIGKNTITSADGGIVGYRGNVVFKGGGSLTIDADGFGVYCDANREASGNITVDGTTLNISVKNSSDYEYSAGYGIEAMALFSVKNGATVDIEGKEGGTYCIRAKGLSIDNSTVNANIFAGDGYMAILSEGDISISNNSKVTAKYNGTSYGVYTPKALTVSDSTLDVESKTVVIFSGGAADIVNSTVKATCTGDPLNWGLYSSDTLSIEGSSDVCSIGNVSAGNGVSVTPSPGSFLDVKVGTKDGGEEGASHLEGSPYGQTAVLGNISRHTYVHIRNHTHVYDQQIPSDGYRVAEATCEAAAQYYYSCLCGQAGTEIFSYGEPAGHSWGEPVWSWKEDHSGATAAFTCRNDASHTQTVNAVIASQTTEATGTAEGKTVYTATVELNGKTYTDTKTIVIPAASTGQGGSAARAGNTPRTGDADNLTLWLLILAASGCALAGALAYNRRRKY